MKNLWDWAWVLFLLLLVIVALEKIFAPGPSPSYKELLEEKRRLGTTVVGLRGELMGQRLRIEFFEEQLPKKDKQLSEKDKQLSEKDKQLSEKDKQISENHRQISGLCKQIQQEKEEKAELYEFLEKAGAPLAGAGR